MHRPISLLLKVVIIGLTLVMPEIAVHSLTHESDLTASLAATTLEPITSGNIDRLTPLARYGTGSPEQALWSPDEKILAVCTSAGVWFYAATDLASPPQLLEAPSACESMAFSPDGSILASVGGFDDNKVHLWDVKTRQQKDVLEGRGELFSVAFGVNLGNASSLISALPYNTWAIKTDTQELILSAGESLSSRAFNADSTLFAFSNGAGVWVWNMQLGKAQSSWRANATSLAFSPDSRLLATGIIGATVRLWNVKSGKQVALLPQQTGVNSVAFSPDGKVLVVGEDSGNITLWNVKTFKVETRLKGHTYRVKSVAFSADGRMLASAGYDQTVRVWDVQQTTQTTVITGFTGGMQSLAFSPDSARLGAGNTDRAVRIWNVNSGKLEHTLIGEKFRVNPTQIAFSPDGQTLAMYVDEYEVQLLRLPTLTTFLRLDASPWTVPIVFSPDGTWLASRGGLQDVRLWNVTTGQYQLISTRHTVPIFALAFSPDGTKLATAGDEGVIRLSDINSNTEIAALSGPRGEIVDVKFSHDGHLLASVGGLPNSTTVRLWDAQTWTLKQVFAANTPYSLTIAFNDDDTLIAAGNDDGTVWLWDVEHGTLRKILLAHTQRVTSLAFSPDGKLLATGSADGTVRLWGVVRAS